MLQAGVSDNRFEVLDVRLSAMLLIDLCSGVRRWYRPDGRLALDEICANTVDGVLGMVRAKQGRKAVRSSSFGLDFAAFIDELQAIPLIAVEDDEQAATTI